MGCGRVQWERIGRRRSPLLVIVQTQQVGTVLRYLPSRRQASTAAARETMRVSRAHAHARRRSHPTSRHSLHKMPKNKYRDGTK